MTVNALGTKCGFGCRPAGSLQFTADADIFSKNQPPEIFRHSPEAFCDKNKTLHCFKPIIYEHLRDKFRDKIHDKKLRKQSFLSTISACKYE